MAAQKEEFVEELTKPVVKLLLSLIGLFVLRFIITNLPGLGSDVPSTPVTFATLAGGIITVVMVSIIINFGREIEPRLKSVLSGPVEVVNDMSIISKMLIYLLAIIIAYEGLTSLAIPFLVPDPGTWAYDIVFLLGALVPTVIIAQRMFGNLDNLTDLITQQVKSATVQQSECSECGESVRASLEFCPKCGNELDDETARQPETTSMNKCHECGSDLDDGAEFCGSCGTEVPL
jgi:hypothetical protein